MKEKERKIHELDMDENEVNEEEDEDMIPTSSKLGQPKPLVEEM